jgi:hypothetical protein
MDLSSLQVKAEKGDYGLSHAYWYSGEEGITPVGQMSFSPVNQQVLQMDDFADCVMRNKNTIVPGEMGIAGYKNSRSDLPQSCIRKKRKDIS